ncbi:MAG: hypothetical protein HGA76_09385, partial [Candidatus Firestonebacteria bacterium]|nr:hypothetical protein [Candidatus Firestonebacteria bacterium]
MDFFQADNKNFVSRHRTWCAILTAWAVILYAVPAWGSWQISTVGTAGDWFESVSVTAGRDGSNTLYIYATSADGYLYEYGWSGSAWVGGAIGSNQGSYLHGVSAGYGRNDGRMRVYVSSDGYPLYEYFYNGAAWQQTAAPSGPTFYFNCSLGPGRNTGVNYDYVPGQNGHVYEYAWNGSAYAAADLGNPGGAAASHVTLGDGQNDGVMRVYSSNFDNHIYEYTYSGSVWTRADVGSADDQFNSVAVGAGGSLGGTKNSVYGAYDNGRLYEFIWNGAAWTRQDMGGPGVAGQYMWDISIGAGRNDGVTRIYACSNNGHAYEYSWSGSAWNWSDLGQASVSPQ